MRAISFTKNIPKALAVKAISKVWPDVAYTPLSPTRFEVIDTPALPGPRWVRVQNRLCGICGSDLSLLRVQVDPSISVAATPGVDKIFLGHEVISEVVEVGSAVTRFEPGDRVVMDTRWQGATCRSQEIDPPCRHCVSGNFPLCENASANRGPRGVGGGFGDGYTAHETEIYKVPKGIDDEQGMMVEPLSVGLRAVLLRTPQPGDRVLVFGSGIIGLNLIQSIKALQPDCTVIAVARYDHQADAARHLGADDVFRGSELWHAFAQLTGAKLYEGMFGNKMMLGGFDIVYDCVGNASTVTDCLRWARAGGTVVLVGIKLAPMKVDLTPVWYQEVDLVGLYAHGVEKHDGRDRHTYDLVIELLQQGKLTTEGLVTHRYSLDRWKTAVATAENKRSGAIKVAFDY